jgi:hypothetical protein
VLVPQCSEAALSGELGRVVEPVDVWYRPRHERLFEQLDDAALEKDDLALNLGLREHWKEVSGVVSWLVSNDD